VLKNHSSRRVHPEKFLNKCGVLGETESQEEVEMGRLVSEEMAGKHYAELRQISPFGEDFFPKNLRLSTPSHDVSRPAKSASF